MQTKCGVQVLANLRSARAIHRIASGTVAGSKPLAVQDRKEDLIGAAIGAIGDGVGAKAFDADKHSFLLASRGGVLELAGVLNLNHLEFPFRRRAPL